VGAEVAPADRQVAFGGRVQHSSERKARSVERAEVVANVKREMRKS